MELLAGINIVAFKVPFLSVFAFPTFFIKYSTKKRSSTSV